MIGFIFMIYIHKIEQFARIQPILKSNCASFPLNDFFLGMNIKKNRGRGLARAFMYWTSYLYSMVMFSDTLDKLPAAGLHYCFDKFLNKKKSYIFF